MMMTRDAAPLRVLIVDDEPGTRRFLRATLASEGYSTLELDGGAGVVGALNGHMADFVLLDLGLPDMDGLQVLQHIRAAGATVPVIIVSNQLDETTKVQALDLGADDYMTKPFGTHELLARMRSARRRHQAPPASAPVFRSGDLAVDLARRTVTVRGAEIKLSPREYSVLAVFVAHADKVLTHDFIVRNAWGKATDVQYLRIYVHALRRKIEREPDRPHYILTETGVGYRLRITD
jgi:two-component system KDP operon response regulator KdpE